jgi:hypothetical protein
MTLSQNRQQQGNSRSLQAGAKMAAPSTSDLKTAGFYKM